MTPASATGARTAQHSWWGNNGAFLAANFEVIDWQAKQVDLQQHMQRAWKKQPDNKALPKGAFIESQCRVAAFKLIKTA